MIEHIIRQFVFVNDKAITSVIVDIQKCMFDSDPLFADGEDAKLLTKLNVSE